MIHKNFSPQSFGLPAYDIADQVNEQLRSYNSLIITAPPGAGKSTLLPLTMLSRVPDDKRILMLEPRRLAARQIAERMSDMLGEEVGQTVGYRIRFETRVSDRTRVEVLTEGILTRMLLSDNELKGVAMVIFDEFHERSLFADVALALCRECQQILRPDLKIVIMSATIDASLLAEKLTAPVVESAGRMFPVEILNVGDCDVKSIAAQTTHFVREAYNKESGDILAFLPGEAEIRQCEEVLRQAFPEASVHALYGQLPPSKQRAAILPSRDGRRKIVLSTPIAETSLTIEGVRIVVDSGFCRQLVFNPTSGLSHLETVRISLDMANQRAGRAGRLTEGVCYRLWSKATESRMKPNREPEIEQADLAQLVLDLAAWGETQPQNLTWLTPPPAGHIAQARELLEMLRAVDDAGRITPHGRELNALPCHPRVAQMLLMSADDQEKSLACDIAALLDERDPLGREAGTDINKRIEALRRNRQEKRGNRLFDRIEKVAAQYRSLIGAGVDNDMPDAFQTGFLIAAAYPERIASAHAGNNACFMLSNGSIAQMPHTDDLAHEAWLAVAHLDARDDRGKIFLASPLDPTDLRSLITERDNVSWNAKQGAVVMQHELRIGRLVLSAKPLHNVDRALVDEVVLQAVERDGRSLLNFSDEVEQLQNRILSLRAWGEKDWPDFSTDALLASVRSWLHPYLGKATTTSDLKKINLREALFYMLSYEQQQSLATLAPEQLRVPSGSRIRLSYSANGAPPVLAVRLQELFGLAETPTVCAGRQRVLLHLLSPGYKPVQITQDLRSFWENTYFEVRKELKSRYPKHVWPDDPWNEPATNRTKRRSQ